MLKRLRQAWALSKKDPATIEKLATIPKEDMARIPDIGDGNGVFMSEGTEADHEQFIKEENGLAPWYKRILNP